MDGEQAAINQVTEVTLRGPAARIAEVSVTSLERVHSISVADGGARALFRSIAGADWGTTFSFASAPGPATFFLRPWLCPRVSNAVSASLRGALAIEERLVDLDDTGKFWTNGQLGDGVLSICRYGSGNGSGGDEATFQDGPDLCAESTRVGTQIEIVDAQHNVVSRPTVCAAGFGLASSAAFAGTVRVQLEKDTDDTSGIAFTLAINHCLPAGTALPTVVAPVDVLRSTCPVEAVSLRVGGGVDKPRSYPLYAGTWTIQEASPDRSSPHVSQIALTFSSGDGGVTYSVRGSVALPQLLF